VVVHVTLQERASGGKCWFVQLQEAAGQ
jgi:hypothetical protein